MSKSFSRVKKWAVTNADAIKKRTKHIPGLRVKDALDFSKLHGIDRRYLPEEDDWTKISRGFICDICATVKREEWKQLKKNAELARQARRNQANGNNLNLLSEVTKAITNSVHVSLNRRGRGTNLLKDKPSKTERLNEAAQKSQIHKMAINENQELKQNIEGMAEMIKTLQT